MLNGTIYKISFANTDKVYIGQTVDFNRRKRAHLNVLKSGTGAKKLQDAFDTYGNPQFEILLEGLSSQKELDDCENEAISIYDSCNNGFNTHNTSRAGFTACYGELNGNSKFSNAEIIEFMNYVIANPTIRLKTVAEIFGMAYVTADEICRGVKHKWLSLAYPIEHAKLLSLVGTRSKAFTAKEMGITYPPIKAPDGTVYEVTALRQFAREHGLNNSSLCAVLNGKQLQHKGWTLA